MRRGARISDRGRDPPTAGAPPAAPSGKLVAVSPTRKPDRGERLLADRLRRREPGVPEELHARYARVTFGYPLHALGDRGAAEDVQQQVFLQVWRRGATFDPWRASPATWILTIARSRAIDHLRRRVPGTVKTRMARGLQRVRMLLEAGA